MEAHTIVICTCMCIVLFPPSFSYTFLTWKRDTSAKESSDRGHNNKLQKRICRFLVNRWRLLFFLILLQWVRRCCSSWVQQSEAPLCLEADGECNPSRWRIWKWCLTGGVWWDFWHSFEACCPLRPQMHCTDCSARFWMRISCLTQASRSRSSTGPASTSSTRTCNCIWRPRTCVAVLAKRSSARSRTPPTPPPPSQVNINYFPLKSQSNGWISVVFAYNLPFSVHAWSWSIPQLDGILPYGDHCEFSFVYTVPRVLAKFGIPNCSVKCTGSLKLRSDREHFILVKSTAFALLNIQMSRVQNPCTVLEHSKM